MNKDNIKPIEISALPFVAEAFSINKKIYKHIDKIYNKDKIKFIEFAKKNKFYNHKMSQEGSIIQEYYFKKSLGILIAAQTDEDIYNKIIIICQKGWKYTYTYIQQHNDIKLSIFLNKYVKKNKGIDNISDDDINANICILMFLSNQLQKKLDIKDKLYNSTIQYYIQRIQHYNDNNRISIKNLSKEELRQLRDLELKIQNKAKISITIPSSYRLSNDKYENMIINIDKLSEEDKYFSAFEYIYDLENISLIGIVGDDFLKSKDIQELIFCYAQFFRKDHNEKIDINKLTQYLYPAIQIRYLSREYKKAKKYFFENFNEQLYEEISQVENENRNIKKKELLLQDENERLKLKVEELERENKRLKLKLNEIDSNKNELVALREFMFNIDKDNPIIENKLDYNILNEYKGVIIGGMNSWQNKLKEILKEWKFISVEAINFDENILRNSEYIFINIGYLSHAMYYKVISIINKHDKKIFFINNQNINICLNEIYNKIKN